MAHNASNASLSSNTLNIRTHIFRSIRPFQISYTWIELLKGWSRMIIYHTMGLLCNRCLTPRWKQDSLVGWLAGLLATFFFFPLNLSICHFVLLVPFNIDFSAAFHCPSFSNSSSLSLLNAHSHSFLNWFSSTFERHKISFYCLKSNIFTLQPNT